MCVRDREKHHHSSCQETGSVVSFNIGRRTFVFDVEPAEKIKIISNVKKWFLLFYFHSKRISDVH